MNNGLSNAQTNESIIKVYAVETLESPDIILQQKRATLVKSRISNLQSALPIQNNTIEAKKEYADTMEYSWLRYAITPFEKTPEYTTWKNTFEQLQQSFTSTKSKLLTAQNTLFAKKSELTGLEVQIALIKKQLEVLKQDDKSSATTSSEINILKSTQASLEDKFQQMKNNPDYNIAAQESAVTELKTQLQSRPFGYTAIIDHINTKPKLVKDHYDSQRTKIQDTISTRNQKNLSNDSNPEYLKLQNDVKSFEGKIKDYNEQISGLKNNIANSNRKEFQESKQIQSLTKEKFVAFKQFLDANLQLKAYAGLDKEQDRASGALQVVTYDLMLQDLRSQSTGFISQFYQKERLENITSNVESGLIDQSLQQSTSKDNIFKGVINSKSSNSNFINWRENIFYQNINDYYQSTFSSDIESTYWSPDPIGLIVEKKSFEKDYQDYVDYKNRNNILPQVVTSVTSALHAAQQYQGYVEDFVRYDTNQIQKGYIEGVNNFITPQYEDSNTQLDSSQKSLLIINDKIKILDDDVTALQKKYPEKIYAVNDKGDLKVKTNELNSSERTQRILYIGEKRKIDVELSPLNNQKNELLPDITNFKELAKNLQTISSDYSIANGSISNIVPPVYTDTYQNSNYPVKTTTLIQTPKVEINLADILNATDYDSELDKK